MTVFSLIVVPETVSINSFSSIVPDDDKNPLLALLLSLFDRLVGDNDRLRDLSGLLLAELVRRLRPLSSFRTLKVNCGRGEIITESDDRIDSPLFLLVDSSSFLSWIALVKDGVEFILTLLFTAPDFALKVEANADDVVEIGEGGVNGSGLLCENRDGAGESSIEVVSFVCGVADWVADLL